MNGRLLIVEDQTFFRKGLRKMIEDHTIGWTVVGEAENGREALEIIERQQPDLVITDIRLPGMDGIELAEHIYRNRLGIDLIVLTGYEDFSYAQAALRNGAIDFLLKPCNEETLIGVLHKAYEHMLARCQRKQQMLESQRVKEETSIRAFTLRLPQATDEVKSLAEHCRNRQLFFVFVSSYFPEGKQYQSRDLGLLQFAIINILSELMEQNKLGFRLVPLEYDQFALFLEHERSEGLLSSVEQNIRSYLGISITVYPYGVIAKLNDLPDNYDRFRRLLDLPTRDLQTHNGAALSASSAFNNQSRVKELQVQLFADIALGRVHNLRENLEAAITRLASLPLEDAKMEAVTLAFAMNATARQSFDTGEENSALGDKIERLPNAATPFDAAEWAREAMGMFLAEYEEWKEGKNHNIIKKTLDYLDNHYTESFNLTDIAVQFHISTAYLSKLIKKETGDNFSTYLTKIRMQKAAMLLLNTEMKVFEIASSVGYDDPNYFTNVFRMLHKCSPSDYRKQNK